MCILLIKLVFHPLATGRVRESIWDGGKGAGQAGGGGGGEGGGFTDSAPGQSVLPSDGLPIILGRGDEGGEEIV